MAKDYLKDLSPDSQCYKVVAYMQKHGSITPADAFLKLGVYRLGSRIYDCRSIGIPITTYMMEHQMDDGSIKRYAKYVIDERSMACMR